MVTVVHHSSLQQGKADAAAPGVAVVVVAAAVVDGEEACVAVVGTAATGLPLHVVVAAAAVGRAESPSASGEPTAAPWPPNQMDL